MRYKKLKYNDKIIKNEIKIEEILEKEKLYWLFEADIYNADIEIYNKTLIWNDGIFYNGKWHYGIFRGGEFHGLWKNGIFDGGIFNGVWVDGIFISGDIKSLIYK